MSWTALVPIKSVALRKSRLAPHLSPLERTMLSEAMLGRVLSRLHDCASIGRVLLLSPSPIGSHDWVRDRGRGLNEELVQARSVSGTGPTLVVHPDLPLLATEDVDVLLAAATRHGQAIAPDRHRTGTNAVALADGAPIVWRFGAGSLARHRDVLRKSHVVVERPGLMLDCDRPEDLTMAERGGFVWRGPRRAGFPLRSAGGETL